MISLDSLSGNGPHLAWRVEPPGFSRVVSGALERNAQVLAPTLHKVLGPGTDGRGGPRGPRITRMGVQDKLQKMMGFALPLFHARGIFQYSFGLIPYRKHIHTVGMYIKYWRLVKLS